MRKNSIVLGIIILGLLLVAGCASTSTGSAVKDVSLTGETKEIYVEAFQFGFDPQNIEVNLGDKVRIIATSRDVPHSFTLPAFGVNLYLDGIRQQSTEFIADKPGTFRFFCAVPCGSGHGAMRGTFTVK